MSTGKSFLIVLLLVLAGMAYFVLQPDEHQATVKINNKIIKVELADTPETQHKGLSGHAPLAPDTGMLFVFPDKQPRTFVMREMNFPIDIIWIDHNKIVKIDKKAPPEGVEYKKQYSSGVPVDYVLELPAGWADKNKIKIGDSISYAL